MKFKKHVLAAGLAGLLTSGSSMGAVLLASDVAILEDDNIEYALTPELDDAGDPTGDYVVKTTGTLEIGDILSAVVTFTKSLDSSNATVQTLGSPGLELTGVSQIMIVDITADGDFVFGPAPTFEAVYGAGAIAALFSQDPGNFTIGCSSANVADCLAPATDGDPWMVAGFADSDDFWFATSALPVDLEDITIDGVAALDAASKFAVANYALSILENNTGYTFDQQYCAICALLPGGDDSFVDIIGSGDILGGAGLTGPWFARSDFDFQLKRVPEPATVALIGLGLAGLGFSTRRRKS